MVETTKTHKKISALPVLLFLMGLNLPLFSQTDSLKKIKTPRHYFTPTIYTDYYVTPSKNLPHDNTDPGIRRVNQYLKNYQYSQLTGGFYFPLITKDKIHDDQRISNFHLLVTGSYMMAMPRFAGISNHTLLKASLGLRAIYNSGKKGIWFFDATPFMCTDLSAQSKTDVRWASTIVYDYMVNPAFSFRLGVTRTFILGNRFHLPYVGFRFGRLDKTYLSIQFPRNITFSFPMGKKFRGSLYMKPMGGVFNMANSDSILYYKDSTRRNEQTIYYGRYEMIEGFRLDAMFNRHFSCFVSAGFTGFKQLAFYSTKDNANQQLVFRDFYHQTLLRGIFLNAGLTLRIGRAKSIYNNYNIYEVFNMNTTVDPGDNNTNMGDGNIPNAVKNPKPPANLQVKDVQDLIEAQDLY